MEPWSSQEIVISLLHYPLQVLGPGRRVGVWMQGCSIRCPGCISGHTWEQKGGERLAVGELMERIKPFLSRCDGVTISGGEPFDQPEALFSLEEGVREHGVDDVLVYSGYSFRELQGRHGTMLRRFAALVDGEFRQGAETEAGWKGSENQRLFVMSGNHELQRRYQQFAATGSEGRRLQLVAGGGGVFVLGIPGQRDREAIVYGTR